MKASIEPFRIKSIESIGPSTIAQRRRLIREAHYNVVLLRSSDVLIDLLTDSGTSAMSAAQWAALMAGDESYVGSPSYHRFVEAVRKLMPFEHVLPTHQGRAAERILAMVVSREGSLVPSNSHFDTTRGNFEAAGIVAVDLPAPPDDEDARSFRGNLDLARLERLLEESHREIPLVMLTITNNTVGGQPVSLENIRRTKELCQRFGKPLFFDGCRFAENACFIKRREPGYRDRLVGDIVREMFSCADGMTMSAKKDVLSNTGGWLALNNNAWAARAMDLLLLTEGFVTYGGLTGRDLEAIAVGLEEGIDDAYLEHRLDTIEYLGRTLRQAGIPVVEPFGGHAVFVDAKATLPHLPDSAYPGQTLSVALYEKAGIRATETSAVKLDIATGAPQPANGLVRLAIPRRVYTRSHMDYIAEAFAEVLAERERLRGLALVLRASPLSRYAAKFRPISDDNTE